VGEAQRNSPSLSKALRRAVRGGSHVACPGQGDMSQVACLDCSGGSSVVVERGIAYVGNMRNPPAR
jgi:hypothetical protein